ncbi:ATP-dependent RNA helicase DDX19A-like isoform X1 [Saccostrea echinata]|uniref:ATP-dependent RNA helicase DDX19A-like isoform X1 n=1 Tax=Saccostrea echinata TaxID=191078 RepID=UPI002A83CFCB|nr:ATP-dependent RNA helicase DDX19A-like isoform X1 [Saccostrea echinata]
MANLDWGAAVDSQEQALTSQTPGTGSQSLNWAEEVEKSDLSQEINRITLDKTTVPSKSPSAPAQSGPAHTPTTPPRPGPTQTSQAPPRPVQGTGAMAAAPSQAQDGAGASGDDEEKGTTKEEASLLRKLVHSKLVSSKADLEVLQKDPNSPLYSVKSFEALNLKKELLDGIYSMGYNTPSKIQETALPVLLADPPVNMIAQSQSGTGKTAAFVLTMLSRVDTNLHYPQCLCIAPTYELALQIGKNVEEMGKFMTDLKIEYAIRGEKLSRGTKLYGHLIIGTPGTVCDWALKFRFFDLKKIKVFVLDEADVMIATQGHQDQSIRIQRGLGKDCQMLLFSATYEDEVMRFAQAVIPNNPIVIRLRREEQSLDNIKQYYIECSDQEGKFQALSNIYGSISIGQSMIFCATRKTAAWLAEKMTKEGHAVGLLSGELSIEQRAAIINRFKEAKEKVLITTNVTARGIDVEQVTVVVNFDLPLTPPPENKPDFETYLHRIGRTGRFGKKGLAINMVDGQRTFQTMKAIERYFGREIKKLDADDIEEVEKIGS